MQTIEKLIKSVPNIHVLEVVIGIHSTLVKTADNCGISSTIKYACPHENIQNAGNLEQMNLRELAEFALSKNLLEASIGMAAINCAFSARIDEYKEVNAKDIILKKGKHKTLGIIGHFPFLEKQRDQYKNCYIFEKQPREGDLLESDIAEYLPKVDVAAITATSLTNHTFDGILKHLPKQSFNIILGPSTPLAPILFNVGIDAISGTLVEDYELVKKYVEQASPTRYLKGIKYVTIWKEDYL